MTRQHTIQFLGFFFGTMLLSYALHLWMMEHFSLFCDLQMIELSYLFNTAYTIFLVFFLFLNHKKYKDHIGFIFMAGSFLKLMIFLLLVKWSGFHLDKNVFLDFFIPYLLSLSLEVYWVARILNPSH